MASPELKEYQGNCHCGAFKFKVNLPEVKTATACNCSICHRKGYLWLFPGEGQLTIEKGEGILTSYEFAGKTMGHRFCPTCGTGVMGFRFDGAPGKKIGINSRTLQGVDPFSLETSRFDGLNKFQPAYNPPKFTGELPHVDGEGLKLYTGSCHCGAVTLALKCKPLPEMELRDCNCSICQRNAYTFVYPHHSQVSISGAENTTGYRFGRKFVQHHFCKICGIPLYMKMHGPPKEVFDSWPEAQQEATKKYFDLLPVNLRALNDVEWDELKVKSSKEGPEGYSID